MKNIILDYAHYNLWANTKMCNDFLSKVDEELLDKEVPSSFPSLRKTIVHIWDAETLWYKRLNGEPRPKYPPHSDFNGNFSEFKNEFFKQSRLLIDFVNENNEDSLNADCNYQNTKGEPFTQKVWQCVMHCFNHSSYHRGQIVTMLRNVGFTDLSSTDLITYFRVKK